MSKLLIAILLACTAAGCYVEVPAPTPIYTRPGYVYYGGVWITREYYETHYYHREYRGHTYYHRR